MFDSGDDIVGRNYMLVTFGGWTVSIWPVYYPPCLGIQELLVSPRYLCCLPWSFQWSLLYIPTTEKTSVLLQHWEWDQKVQHYSRRELCVPLSECIATGKEWRYWKWMTRNQSSLTNWYQIESETRTFSKETVLLCRWESITGSFSIVNRVGNVNWSP